MGSRWNRILGLAVGSVLIALLLPSACKRKSLGEEDGGAGQGGSTGGLAFVDGGSGRGGSATGGTSGVGGTSVATDAASDTRADVGRDTSVEAPPPPGFIPCGANACDPAREFCKHDVGGLTGEQRLCWPLPTGCAECGCLLNDPGWRFCFACRVVSGVDVMGLEIDCPGAVG